jgi:hypothetical protein
VTLTGLLRLEADGSVRCELERGGAGVQRRHRELAVRRAVVRSGGHLAQVVAAGPQHLKIVGVTAELDRRGMHPGRLALMRW